MTRQALERFQSKVVEGEGGCRLWTAALNGEGYGVFYLAGKMELAARVSYEMNVGPIPANRVLEYRCRNTRCVNPEHLTPIARAKRAPRRKAVSKPTPPHCGIDDCDGAHHANGWCATHYRQLARGREDLAPWLEPTYPPLVAYLEDRRRRGIPPEGVPMEGEAA